MPERLMAEEVDHRHQVGVVEIALHHVRVLHEGVGPVALSHQVEVGGWLVAESRAAARTKLQVGGKHTSAGGTTLLLACSNTIEIAVLAVVEQALHDVAAIYHRVDG